MKLIQCEKSKNKKETQPNCERYTTKNIINPYIFVCLKYSMAEQPSTKATNDPHE